jgi:hypothetical protein
MIETQSFWFPEITFHFPQSLEFPGQPQPQSTQPTATPPTPASEGQLSYDELCKQHEELQVSFKAAYKEISRLNAQASYLKGLLQYADKGLKIKLDESKRLHLENSNLKVVSYFTY